MFIIPIIGFVTFIYHGRVFHFGFFDLNFGIKKDPAIFEPTEDIHGYLAYALFRRSRGCMRLPRCGTILSGATVSSSEYGPLEFRCYAFHMHPLLRFLLISVIFTVGSMTSPVSAAPGAYFDSSGRDDVLSRAASR